MRLRKLELQGFKTFATRTDLVFDGGVTAIVGPNGSGKSNIADAIRWALGEQSHRMLRSKRAEDLIFSGSELRPRVGMATVSLVLDNSQKWLPVEFEEVKITRRIYRSGESEYRLNGKRTRLRDILELLAESGLSRRTYTVIGQGLVDRALSLRAEERRILFEEAAGITPYQQKRNLALNRLEETKANLVRIHDIIRETEPRLRYLERQAKKAQESKDVLDELKSLLLKWYGYLWTKAQAEKESAEQAESKEHGKLQSLEEDLRSLEGTRGELEERRRSLRASILEWEQEIKNISHQMERLERSRAVGEERIRLLETQRSELEAEIAELRERLKDESTGVEELERKVQSLEAEKTEIEAEVREAEKALGLRRKALADLESKRETARQNASRLAAELQQIEERLEEIETRREEILREKEEIGESLRAAAEELERRKEEVSAAAKALEDAKKALESAHASLASLQKQQESLRNEISTQQEKLGKAIQSVRELEARKEMLERLQEEGAGLYNGVRAVMKARNRLSGILGIVADLISVPKELELAIEVALGGHQQDVVVRSWSDAEKAVEFLKRERAGRATFLPLDTLKPRRPIEAPRLPGVMGTASFLVEAPPDHEKVVHYLLGRTIVVENLKVAREVLRKLSGGYQVVTPEGEVVQSSGTVTGGSRRKQGAGIIARSREIKSLPALIAKAKEKADAEAEKLADMQSRLESLSAEIAEAQRKVRSAEEEVARAQERWLEARGGEQAAYQKVQWQKEKLERLEKEIGSLDESERVLKMRRAEASRRRGELEVEVADLSARLLEAQEETLQSESARLAEAKAKLAGFLSRWEQQRNDLTVQRRRLEQAMRQLQAKEERLHRLEEELEATRQKDLQEEKLLQELAEKREELTAALQPAMNELQEIESRLEALRDERDALEKAMREQEEAYRRALIEKERAIDALRRLRSEIEEATLDYDLFSELPDDPTQELPVVLELEEGTSDRISELKGRLRRLGGVNPEVLAEYESVKSHYDFLQSQAEDLEQGIESLKELVAELDRKMEKAFMSTYREVAKEFKEYFTRLFGGGQARLELTDPDNPSETGVEIHVRPPGKRPLGLALLSGGERTLTAAALLFSILKVTKPPFVVLDEVDAALDEANVGRFREALQELSKDTQFVVITHNRGTIEAAHYVYGVSMQPDGTSQVLSLKLEEMKEAA